MAIKKNVNGNEEIIANKSVVDHSQLTGREAYGAHPISAIRKLPEKLSALKQKDDDLKNELEGYAEKYTEKFAELDEKDRLLDEKDAELDEKDSQLASKLDYTEQHSQQIDVNVDENLHLQFRNYDGNTKEFTTGYLPDDTTIELDENEKLKIKKVYSDEDTVVGIGTEESPIELKNKPDEDTIITDTDNNLIYATAFKDEKGKITPQDIRDHIQENEEDLTEIRKNVVELQTITHGMGGYLNAHRFDSKEPTKQQLTDYALQDIGITDANEIWDGTKVRNLADDRIWIYDKASDSWTCQDKLPNISDANNDGVHGLVTGSYEHLEGFVDSLGHITINGLSEELSNINNDIDGVDNKLNDSVDALTDKIEKEIEDRTTADTTLQTNLQANIDAEADKRKTDDDEIRNLISDLSSGSTLAFDELKAKIETEITDRQDADNALQQDFTNRLTLEADDRDAKDTELTEKIDNEISDRQQALTDLNTNLQSAINTEKQERIDADSDLQTALDNEIQNRTAADNDINNRISNLKTSNLQNDGNGTSPFATEDYVDTNGGKIDTISINGVNQEIDADKNVNIRLNGTDLQVNENGEIQLNPSLNLANKTYVDEKISDGIANIIDSAPETFDTFKEISDWISQHGQDAADLVSRVSTMETKFTDDITAINESFNDYYTKTETDALLESATAITIRRWN